MEQVLSVAKALSGMVICHFSAFAYVWLCSSVSSADAAGVSFDAQALARQDALAGAIAAVEDHNVSIKDSLQKAKGTLGHLREEMFPKDELIDDLEGLMESFAEGVPMDFKNA